MTGGHGRTIRALLATYDFLDEGNGPINVNAMPGEASKLLLDLNAGLDLGYRLVTPIPLSIKLQEMSTFNLSNLIMRE